MSLYEIESRVAEAKLAAERKRKNKQSTAKENKVSNLDRGNAL